MIHVLFMMSNFSQEEDYLSSLLMPHNINTKFSFAVIQKKDFAINIFCKFYTFILFLKLIFIVLFNLFLLLSLTLQIKIFWFQIIADKNSELLNK